jgi:small subunit ribosomal protein S3
MSHKVHPFSFRLGITRDWKSRWFNLKQYQKFLKEDVTIREYLWNKLKKISVDVVDIERSGNMIKIIIRTARPGLLIGRGGSGIEQLQKDIEKFVYKIRKEKPPVEKKGAKKDQHGAPKVMVKIEVEEIKNPDSHALIVAQNIADQIEKRIAFRRAMKEAIAKAKQQRDVKGIKVKMSGRLGGSEIARTEWLADGKIPLQTLRSDVDYGFTEAFCTYGKVGIKVWIYKGEVFGGKKENK